MFEFIQLNQFLFFAFLYAATFILGELLERIRIPWVFAALFLGIGFSINNPFESFTSGEPFNSFALLGLYFLLFIFGFEISLKEIKNHKRLVFETNAVMILVQATLGAVIISFLFGYDILTSAVIGLVFATVSEIFVLPLLEETKLIKSHLGQSILGISAVNSLFLVLVVTIATVFLSQKTKGIIQSELLTIFIVIIILFLLSFFLMKMKHESKRIKFFGIGAFTTFVLFLMFLFLGFGFNSHLTAISAILAGIAIRNFLPENKIGEIEIGTKTMIYGFFVPLFMFWSGLDADINFIVQNIPLIILITVLFKATKIGSVVLATRKKVGFRKSLFIGTSLSVELSLSIVLLKLMLENALISTEVFSLLLSVMILSEVLVPFALARMLSKWKADILGN